MYAKKKRVYLPLAEHRQQASIKVSIVSTLGCFSIGSHT